MSSHGSVTSKRRKRARKPLDPVALRDLALSYVARFATSGAKLEAYLLRKIRERGVAEDSEGRQVQLDVPVLVEQMIELGYVDDAAYARARTRDLMARGYGARRVDQALYAAGIDEHVREDQKPSDAAARQAAVLLARKRRFGPFGRQLDRQELDPKLREKQIAAMLRAGHSFETVRFIVHSDSQDEIDDWLGEVEGEENQQW